MIPFFIKRCNVGLCPKPNWWNPSQKFYVRRMFSERCIMVTRTLCPNIRLTYFCRYPLTSPERSAYETFSERPPYVRVMQLYGCPQRPFLHAILCRLIPPQSPLPSHLLPHGPSWYVTRHVWNLVVKCTHIHNER